jgi:protein-tyrosine phosphatase
MIDLHCHLLPGIDDGPRTAQESVELGDAAFADGIRVVAATPHLRGDYPMVRAEELAARCQELRTTFDAYCVPVEIVPAAEVDLTWAQGASEEQLRLASYGQQGTTLLLETPYPPLPPDFERRIFELFTTRGIRVLLAHPERNPTFQHDPERLAELVRRDVLVQVTAHSLVEAARRSRSRRLAEALVKEGLAHVIASDSHGTSDSHASRRGSPRLADAVRAAEALAPERARWMVSDAPAAVIAGAPLVPPSSPRPRGLLGRFARG